MSYWKETLVIGALTFALSAGCTYGVQQGLLASFCNAFECRGNAPGECPLPPMCPRR